jgi:hypothetical protein
MGRAILGILSETFRNLPNTPSVHANRRVESTPTTSYTSIIRRTTTIRILIWISYWILDTDIPSGQDDSLILIKATSSRAEAGDRFPHKQWHSFHRILRGWNISHTDNTSLTYFLFHRLYQCPHAWKYFSSVSQNVMKHHGSGNVRLENKAKCTNCKTKFHSSQNSGDWWILKCKILPVFTASNKNRRWINKVFNFDTKLKLVVGSALRLRYLHRKTPTQ